MISPLRILMLYRHDGFVQTQALYSMEAPWLPKSESGTRSPSLHLRHRGNAFSTKSPPSFLLSGADTPCHKYTGILPSSKKLATAHYWSSSKGSLSRSVLQSYRVGPPVSECPPVQLMHTEQQTIYPLGKNCAPAKQNRNSTQACYSYVKRELGNSSHSSLEDRMKQPSGCSQADPLIGDQVPDALIIIP